jgi:hypothetical protein
VFLVLLCGWAATAQAEPAAPYSKDASDAINKAMEQTRPTVMPKDLPTLERTRVTLEWFRAGYRAAGYDFDATVRQVLDDYLQQRLGEGDIFMGILMVIGMMTKDCEAAKVDCLTLFPSDVGAPIRRMQALVSATTLPSAKQAEAEIPPRWEAFRLALAATDIERAVTYFIPQARAKYRQIFGALQERLPTIADGLVTISFITPHENRAQYRVKRMETFSGKSQEITYYIYFQRIAGTWFIESF